LLKWKKWKRIKFILFSVKCKLFSGLGKAWGLSPLLMLIFVHWVWLGIYCNFCSFRVPFIYWKWFVVVLPLEYYLTLFLVSFGLKELFTFLWKTCFVEKVFKINFCLFFIGIIFSIEIKYFSSFRFFFFYKNP
jgi:hypothetical protein